MRFLLLAIVVLLSSGCAALLLAPPVAIDDTPCTLGEQIAAQRWEQRRQEELIAVQRQPSNSQGAYSAGQGFGAFLSGRREPKPCLLPYPMYVPQPPLQSEHTRCTTWEPGQVNCTTTRY